jgi:hypothetical protein
VTALRSYHKIPVHNAVAADQAEWLNLTKAADQLHISAKTLRLAAETGEIPATHPLPDGPWLFSRIILESEAAKRVVLRAKQGTKHPTGPAQEQKTLFDSTT